MSRRKYQQGCLYREKRKAGPHVWVFRYRDGQSNRKEQIGTVDEFPSKLAAMKACESLRVNVNRETRSPRTVAELVAHYQEKELPEDSTKSYSTRKAYQCYFRNWIVPVWGSHKLSAVKTVAVEDWLRTLSLAPGTKAKLRNMMSTLFTHAMRYEWTEPEPNQVGAAISKAAEHAGRFDGRGNPCAACRAIGSVLRDDVHGRRHWFARQRIACAQMG